MNLEKIEDFIVSFNEISLQKQSSKRLNKPTFIGVGAGRCGTSSIYKYLREHPEVYMSPIKEINYFGIRDLDRTKYGISYREYLYYFLGADTEKCIGEISPAYLTIPHSAVQIQKHLPDVKIVIMLRDPIERCISQYKHHLIHHKNADINSYFSLGLEVLKNKPSTDYMYNWYNPAKNITQSLYSQGVKTFIEEFGKDNVLVLTYDFLRDAESSILIDLCKFLDITYVEQILTKANSSNSIKIHSVELNERVLHNLYQFFMEDLLILDDFLGLKTSEWLSKYL